MTSHVAVSVIIPSFNQGAFLAEAVQSVLDQTFRDFEIIVVDDASDDGNSTNVALSFSSENVRVITNERNLGVCATRNLAISEAKGKYILPLDADDKIAPTYLERAVESLEFGVADVIYCKARFFGAKCGDWLLPSFSSFRFLFANLVFNCALFKKEDWAEIGGYSEVFRTGYEDWDFWLSFLERKKTFYRIEESLFFYRKHEVSRNTYAIDCRDVLVEALFEHHRELYASYGLTAPPCRGDWKKLRPRPVGLASFTLRIFEKGKQLAVNLFRKRL